ncbi:MAG: hypothetical protein EOM55_02845 [Clostridia bacterium]|nr:hypothetical protein [Clostridia bacterium]
MKNLIVYYSLTGNNEKLAKYLKEKLNFETFEIKTKKKVNFTTIFKGLFLKKFPLLEEYKLNLKSYDKIIFVSPVWFGKLSFPLKSFLKSEHTNIKDYNFLSICLGGQREIMKNELTSIIGKKPSYIEEFSIQKLKNSGKMKLSNKLEEKDFEEIKKEIDLTYIKNLTNKNN